MRISKKKQEILNKMQIYNAKDMLKHYPFRYEYKSYIPLEQWKIDDKIAVEGIIISEASVLRFQKRSLTRFQILVEGQMFLVSIFNRPWVSQFAKQKKITIFGKYEGRNKITASSYNFQPLTQQLGYEAIYTTKEGLTQKDIKKFMQQAWEEEQSVIQDIIPEDLRKKYRLIPKKQAIFWIHWPINEESLKQSLRYLKYEEFFLFQLTMQSIKKESFLYRKGCKKVFDEKKVFALEKQLPFTLTNGQKSAISEILADLKSDKVMVRMLQGDVGCGKTLVAAFGMYACVLANKQAALMAPTEILAKQHGKSLKKLFHSCNIEVELLYASMKTHEKVEVLRKLKANEIDILVGTHALFQDEVSFYDLGMVVADEQHRFGVQQRRRLLEKGEKVDFLLMSATPIPRTLAISFYADMDVSTIQELPQGRKEVITSIIQESSMSSILVDILNKIDHGMQCYVVCAAIEKKEEQTLKTAESIYEGLKMSLGKKYAIGLLHGRMNASQKDIIMQQFLENKLKILVSTTVIEVGVDVKNANIMVIYDADRFGLSQLHQLRGRVGRGTQQGYCYLLTSSKDEESLKRLEVLQNNSDGFMIAKADLELRGPGDLMGTRQSGVPSFILADLVKDQNILEIAKQDVQTIFERIEDYPILYEYIKHSQIIID